MSKVGLTEPVGKAAGSTVQHIPRLGVLLDHRVPWWLYDSRNAYMSRAINVLWVTSEICR